MSMHKYFLVLFLITAPLVVFGHTSDERYVDGYVVDMGTAPIAPWVNEKMGMSFTFRDPFTSLATTTVRSAHYEIIALMRTGGKPPESLYQSPMFMVTDGGFATDHAFLEEGTYDMHVTFVDDKGNEHLAGFRKQVRTGGNGVPGMTPQLFFGTLLVVAAIMFTAGRISHKQKSA